MLRGLMLIFSVLSWIVGCLGSGFSWIRARNLSCMTVSLNTCSHTPSSAVVLPKMAVVRLNDITVDDKFVSVADVSLSWGFSWLAITADLPRVQTILFFVFLQYAPCC